MKNPEAKTPKQIAAKQRAFMRRIFGDNYADKTSADFIDQAWRDTTRRVPLYAKSEPEGSPGRIALQQFAKNKIAQIGAKMTGGGGVFALKGRAANAQLTNTLAKRRVNTAHIGHLIKLQEAITRKHGKTLASGGMKFGHVQKLLNKYLKYMWCAGKMPRPPACPFDGRILKWHLPRRKNAFWQELHPGGNRHLAKQPKHKNIRLWSQSDSIEDYLVWLAAGDEMRKRLNYNSLAEWELFIFEA
ncbi:MAG: hypothetical protein ACR2P4_01845, partial [Gammaproteobacteria bacterium]